MRIISPSPVLSVLALSAAASAQPTLTRIDPPASGALSVRTSGISSHGTVVVGNLLINLAPTFGGFYWTRSGGSQSFFDSCSAVSGDGSVLVGRGSLGALRCGPQGCQEFGDEDTVPSAVSDDGSVVVGTAGPFTHAFRWTSAGGLQDLGVLPGDVVSYARGVSGDGSVVVGNSVSPLSTAFVWTQATGMRALPTPPDTIESYAAAASADGSIIVGWRRSAQTTVAYRWNGANQGYDLDLPEGWTSSAARAVSADGFAIAGSGSGGAFVWSIVRGATDLNTYLPAIGINLTGWVLTGATGNSANGSIVGDGLYYGQERGWIVTFEAACYANCDGSRIAPILNVADFICYLNLYAASDPSANCDGSTAPPVLNVADFICFMTQYAAGCP